MENFKKIIKVFKVLIMIGWFFSVLFLAIALMMYFGGSPVTEQAISMVGFLSVVFLASLTMMTPLFFYAVFGKVWYKGIVELEKERLKMIDEQDKYINSRIKVNNWLEKQIKKDSEK